VQSLVKSRTFSHPCVARSRTAVWAAQEQGWVVRADIAVGRAGQGKGKSKSKGYGKIYGKSKKAGQDNARVGSAKHSILGRASKVNVRAGQRVAGLSTHSL
jgi:hypothetical protein